MSNPPNPFLEAALAYAARGWPVFPCRARAETIEVRDRKTGEVEPKLYKAKTPIPPAGFKAATTDEAVIRKWWRAHPDAMVGVPTGEPIGLFVVDVDAGVDEDGVIYELDELLADLARAHGGELPLTLESRTPRGGAHLWFRMPDVPPIGNRGGMLHRIDVRGTGGFVIVPPSYNPDPHELGHEEAGAAYAWTNEVDPANPTAELVRLVVTKGAANAPAAATLPLAGDVPRSAKFEEFERHARTVLESLVDRVRNARQGGRNDTLNSAAYTLGGYVARGWLTRQAVEARLEDAAAALVQADGRRSVQDTIASGLNAGLAHPVDEAVVAPFAARAFGGGNARPRGRAAAALPARGRSSSLAASSAASIGRTLSPATARSAIAAGAPRPAPPASGGFSQPSRMGGSFGYGGQDGGEGESEEELNEGLSFFPQTDLGNAERFLARYGGSFLYCAPLGGWLAWDGRRWSRPAAEELVARAVAETVRAIGDEAATVAAAGVMWRREKGLSLQDEKARFYRRCMLEETGELDELEGEDLADVDGGPDPVVDVKGKAEEIVRKSDRLKAWGRSSEGAGHLSCIAPIARSWLTVLEDEFDADPFRFNVLNGTLRFWRETDAQGNKVGRVELLEHSPDDRITKLAAVEYDPAAPAAAYDTFLERVQPEQRMRRFLHAWAGYNMTGDISAQKLVFNYGMGANGKSTWVDAIADCMGDYGATTPIETFLDQGRGRKGSDASPDLADLVGKRMVRTSEPEKGAKWADALIKLATGGEPMKVRQLNCPFFELKPAFKLTISGNHRPDVGTDHGIRRRMQLVPWYVTIPEEERDPELPLKLKAERTGILNRMVEGCLDWLANGIPRTLEVDEATTEYFEQTDPLGRFLALCVDSSSKAIGGKVQSSALYRVFQAWAAWAGEKEWTQTGFSRALTDRGFRKKQSDTVQWLDVVLLKSEEDFRAGRDDDDFPPYD